MFEKCVLTILELNWNQHLTWDIKRCSRRSHNCKIGHFPGKNENVCEKSKNERCTCKAHKNTVFHCQICKFVRWPSGDMLQIKKLLQIKWSCCKLRNVAANKIKLLQIKKRCCKLNKVAANLKSLLQIFKTSCCKLKECCCKLKRQKYVRALKEGGVGTRSFIFLSRKLLYFFLGLWDY